MARLAVALRTILTTTVGHTAETMIPTALVTVNRQAAIALAAAQTAIALTIALTIAITRTMPAMV